MRKTAKRPRTRDLLEPLSKLGIFTLQDATRNSIPRATFFRRVEEGKIQRVGRGLYRHPKSRLSTSDLDFAVACARFGENAVIGGLTALQHYGLTDQVPRQIWVMVPYDQKTRDPLYRCIRTKNSPKIGVENKGTYRITNIERTLIESLRYSTKTGLKTAIQATRSAIQQSLTNEQKLLRTAKALGLEKYLLRHWEAVTA